MIAHYDILDSLGQGGMGTVYRARDRRSGELVAVKVLAAQCQRDAGLVERFRFEALTQARLAHPNIVAVRDFVADGQVLAIVMELVDGRPLDEIIQAARGPLPPPWILAVMDQVLSAMAHAHENGVVHRDLKPSNILVEEGGGFPHAKVADFGIARVLGVDKLKTAAGAKLGTLPYMSPEHVRSPHDVDRRSDVYALGATLFEMLTGQVPFDHDTEYGLMERIVRDPVPRVSDVTTSVGRSLDALVATAMAKDPAHRFADCVAFRNALVGRSRSADTGSLTIPSPGPSGVVLPAPPPPEAPAWHAMPTTGPAAPAPPPPADSIPFHPERAAAGLILAMLGLGMPALLSMPARLFVLAPTSGTAAFWRGVLPLHTLVGWLGLLAGLAGRGCLFAATPEGRARPWLAASIGAGALVLLIRLMGSGAGGGWLALSGAVDSAAVVIALSELFRDTDDPWPGGLALGACALVAVGVILQLAAAGVGPGSPPAVLSVLVGTAFDVVFLLLCFRALERARTLPRAARRREEW